MSYNTATAAQRQTVVDLLVQAAKTTKLIHEGGSPLAGQETTLDDLLEKVANALMAIGNSGLNADQFVWNSGQAIQTQVTVDSSGTYLMQLTPTIEGNVIVAVTAQNTGT